MSPPELSGDEIRSIRTMFKLSASQAATLVGLNDGAAWRKWERNGVRGPAAVLLRIMVENRCGLRIKSLCADADKRT